MSVVAMWKFVAQIIIAAVADKTTLFFNVFRVLCEPTPNVSSCALWTYTYTALRNLTGCCTWTVNDTVGVVAAWPRLNALTTLTVNCSSMLLRVCCGSSKMMMCKCFAEVNSYTTVRCRIGCEVVDRIVVGKCTSQEL